MKVTFRGGIHPAHGSKLPTQAKPIREYTADTVLLVMNGHMGAPSNPIVKKGDRVLLGQKIAEPVGALGLPVHASVSGEVIAVERLPYLTQEPPLCVTIQSDHLDTWAPLTPLHDVETANPARIIPAIRDAGICGMGGACFPTHVKLTPPQGKQCDTLIANGAECETHITSDHRLMVENSVRVVDGLRAAMRALNVQNGVIAIEDNKPDAIVAMQSACAGRAGVRVQVLKTKYPQGGEKQLIEAVTRRQVPAGGLPIDVGVIVLNVGTCAAIADAVIDGKPLISRVTTVTGRVANPSNLRLRIGTLAADAIRACEGYTQDAGKILFGGAMTGLCLPHEDFPINMGTGGIVVLGRKEAESLPEDPCIRCGKCVEACPVGLYPYKIKVAADADDLESAQKLHVEDCILCGSCSYQCPARRWLAASFRVARQRIHAQAKEGGGAV